MYHDEQTLIWDFLRDNELATEEEIQLVTSICGFNVKALNDILNCRTEYHDIEQIYACEKYNFYFRDEILAYYGLLDEEETEED